MAIGLHCSNRPCDANPQLLIAIYRGPYFLFVKTASTPPERKVVLSVAGGTFCLASGGPFDGGANCGQHDHGGEQLVVGAGDRASLYGLDEFIQRGGVIIQTQDELV